LGDFYGTGIEIWAGFGLDLGWLALMKKKFGPIMSNFSGQFFHFFIGQ
jgi:hypothetical protein